MSINIGQYLAANAKYFPEEKIPQLKDRLASVDQSRLSTISMLKLKDPTILLVAAVIGGTFGVDRFMLGQTGLGIAKLLTLGGMGIWSVIDWFTITKRTKEANFEMVSSHL